MTASYAFKKCESFKILDGCKGDVCQKTVLGDSETSQSDECVISKIHVEILNKMVS